MKAIIGKMLPMSLKMRGRKFLGRNSISLSQAGQDFWVYGEVFNEMRGGYFLDIGAHDGFIVSNTYILEKRYGWNGICIEANPESFNKLKECRRCRCLNECVDSKEGEVEFVLDETMGGIVDSDCDNTNKGNRRSISLRTIPLAALLERENFPRVIDYLSIDIEGAEDRALLNFDFDRYLFKCITIERPSSELRSVFEKNGYLLIKEIPHLDCFYIHTSIREEYRKNMYAFSFKKFLARRWR